MKIIVSNIHMSPDQEIESLRRAAARKIAIDPSDIKGFKIAKESIDARRKQNIHLVYSVVVEIDSSRSIKTGPDVRILEDLPKEPLTLGSKPLKDRPVIVGSGPAGLFAGLMLAENGYKPLILERGDCVEKRTEKVLTYWQKGILDTETNVQFGEGGAGTFSDGKLTTRINDPRSEKVLEEFYRAGAHKEILYKARPHIGTDVLKHVVVAMRKKIEQFGGEVRFNSKLTSLLFHEDRIHGVVVNGTEKIPSSVVVLAIGHSARDTYQALHSQGVGFIRKPFSIGVRIEHPQELINKAQYGELAGHPVLGAADYQLFYKTGGRTVYSFCMCPGGVVTAAASEQGMIVTNGMSEYARNKENANSALVVSVEPEDFGGSHPLAGVEFQRTWEKLAFEAGGSKGAAPVQRLEDFAEGRNSGRLGSVKPSYTGWVEPADINRCLPGYVTEPMKEAFGYFDRKIKGFAMKDAVLTGVETRTSSPVRIPRGESLEAENIRGLYPTGEGAGYAGGIVSAAVDGIRVAERIIGTYAPI